MRRIVAIFLMASLLVSLVGGSVVLAQEEPTEEPTAEPTEEPTAEPTEEPTAEPTEEPTAEPTEEPTAEPTEEPTAEPTEEPTAEPTEEPTAEPTEEPTAEPTEEPTAEPTEEPTAEPTEEPTAEPTEEPTAEPTEESAVNATGAMAGPWNTIIAVANPTNTTADSVMVTFYQDDGTSVDYNAGTINAHGSKELIVSSVSGLGDGIYSAVVNSSTQVQAVAVLDVNDSTDREIYTSFSSGSSTALMPAVSCQAYDQTSVLAVQNVGSSTASVHAAYTEMGETSPEKEFDFDVLAGSAEVIDSCTDARTLLGSNWLGSAVFTATGSEIVVVNHQPYINTSKAVSFEGAASGSNTLYLPTAMRDIYHNKQTTFYAIQNTSSTASAQVTITYVRAPGNTASPATSTQVATIEPLEKKALGPKSGVGGEACNPPISEDWIGSARLEATGASVVGITNIGVGAGNCPATAGLATAFLLPSTASAHYSLPYVHWTDSSPNTEWQSYIAVQNVNESSNASFTVHYYNQSGGTAAWSHAFTNIEPGEKGVSYWGLHSNTDFTGSVVVEGATGSEELVVLVTNQQATGCYGASYIGSPFTP